MPMLQLEASPADSNSSAGGVGVVSAWTVAGSSREASRAGRNMRGETSGEGADPVSASRLTQVLRTAGQRMTDGLAAPHACGTRRTAWYVRTIPPTGTG